MGKAAEEVVGQRRSRGDLGHGEEGEGRRRGDQSEGPGRGALEENDWNKGPDKEVLTHLVEEGYECNLAGHTVGRGILLDTVQAHTEKRAVVGEYRSTFQGVVAEGKLAGLWVVQTCASPQRGGQLASLSGP